MKETEMKHAEVPAALDLVVEEVGKESQRIRDAGGEALCVVPAVSRPPRCFATVRKALFVTPLVTSVTWSCVDFDGVTLEMTKNVIIMLI